MHSYHDVQDSFQYFGAYCARIFIIFGGIVPYIPQYVHIQRTGSIDGFSIYVSLAIVLSSCLKICLWFILRYDTPLFYQCIVMILMMFVMIELRVRVMHRHHEISEDEERNFLDWSLKYFWDWTNLISYVQAIVFFLLASAFVVIFFGWIQGVSTGISYVAVLFDAMVALPQFISNLRNASTNGMSAIMVYSWAAGDLCKVFYMLTREVPLAFILCAFFQFFLDLAILGQLYYYRDRVN